jgi:hypothetical protein
VRPIALVRCWGLRCRCLPHAQAGEAEAGEGLRQILNQSNHQVRNRPPSLPHRLAMRIAAGIRIAASCPRRENCGHCRVYHDASQITELNGGYKF